MCNVCARARVCVFVRVRVAAAASRFINRTAAVRLTETAAAATVGRRVYFCVR